MLLRQKYNLLDIFYDINGHADVTFLLVQQGQLKHGKWHQVVVMLNIIFTATIEKQKKQTKLNNLM